MKRHLFLIMLCFGTIVSAFAQRNYGQLTSEAERLYRLKDFVKSSEMYSRAFQRGKTDKIHLYNAACSAALTGEYDKAIDYLDMSIENGWRDLTHLTRDRDFLSLHDHPGWIKLIAKLEAKISRLELGYNKEAKDILEAIYNVDQQIRAEFMLAYRNEKADPSKIDSIQKMMIKYDSLNTIAVAKIIDQYGWLSDEQVGGKANQALFLVIQHADLETQIRYLPILRRAVRKGKATPSSIALLSDRVALRTGKRQVYGTQISAVPNQSQQFYVSPLKNPKKVDKRRAMVGLNPMSEYVKQWDIVWNIETYRQMLSQYKKWENAVHQSL